MGVIENQWRQSFRKLNLPLNRHFDLECFELGGVFDSSQVVQDARLRIDVGVAGFTPVFHTVASPAGDTDRWSWCRQPPLANRPMLAGEA
jgi:hypothetical protein